MKILAIIGIVYGIFTLLVALLGLVGSALLAAGLNSTIKYSAATLAYATVSDVILGVLYLAFGIGALRLKSWAWTTGVVVLVLDIARQLVGFAIQGVGIGKVVIAVITIVIALALLWYLFRPHVRAAFGKVPNVSRSA